MTDQIIRPPKGTVFTVRKIGDPLYGIQVVSRGDIIDYEDEAETKGKILVLVRVHKSIMGERGAYFSRSSTDVYYVGVINSFSHEKTYFAYNLDDLEINDGGYTGDNLERIRLFQNGLI